MREREEREGMQRGIDNEAWTESIGGDSGQKITNLILVGRHNINCYQIGTRS